MNIRTRGVQAVSSIREIEENASYYYGHARTYPIFSKIFLAKPSWQADKEYEAYEKQRSY
jgi:hypothetical protein